MSHIISVPENLSSPLGFVCGQTCRSTRTH
jgi:hypothetical protein